MIGEAIQSTLGAIIPNTFSQIGDEGIRTPFCIHEENEQEPLYLKDGVTECNWAVEIAIVDDSPDSCEELALLVIDAVNALAFTTVNNTEFGPITYLGKDPGFDSQTKEYIRVLRFSIITQNK
jgi:hypothetical protein